jgi:hypothetical protein
MKAILLIVWFLVTTQLALTPTPLPERERGSEVRFLFSPPWEKGLGDEGKSSSNPEAE